MKTALIFAAILIVVALAGIVLYGRERLWERLAGPADLGRYDFDRGTRSPSGNDALACSEGLCSNPDIVLPTLAGTPAHVAKRLTAELELLEPRHRRVDDGADPAYARYVVYSRLMRFPDTVDIEALPGPSGTGIRIYSRAQLGSGDFGVNRKRLEALAARLSGGRG